MNGSIGSPAEQTGRSSEQRLLAILQYLVNELRDGGGGVRMDSHLDRALGLDSLARVELLLRLEREFGASLPAGVLVEAETPHDLLLPFGAAAGLAADNEAGQPMPLDAVQSHGTPAGAATLMEVLEWHARGAPGRVYVHLYNGDGPAMPLTHYDLYEDARRLAGGLRARGVAPGQAVALMLPTGREFLAAFFGVLLAGAVPAPLYPPVRRSAMEEHARRQAAILNNCEAPVFITLPEVRTLSPLLKGLAPGLRTVVTAEELMMDAQPGERPARAAGDIALLQYTSGSTGDPKGVILTHANLLANIRAMGEAVAVRPDKDVFVSWLPLYHDMGLIGVCLGSLYYGMPLVLMSPLTFLARPTRWLRAIHRHRATLSAGPNFAYDLCATKIADEELAGLDLSSWRVAFNGAEQVSAETLRRFASRYAAYGFRAEALAPVYGLAESSVGLAFPPLNRGPLIDSIDREKLMHGGIASPSAAPALTINIVGCGRALPRPAVRVVGARGRVSEARHGGRVQLRGPSSCRCHFRNPEATARLIQGEWLDSGDRGYLVDGEIFITGRVKDIIIRAGHNIYPNELEEAVGAIAGIRQGGVAAFASRDLARGTERLVIVAETRERRPAAREGLRSAVNEAVTHVIGNPPDEVVLAPPRVGGRRHVGAPRRDAGGGGVVCDLCVGRVHRRCHRGDCRREHAALAACAADVVYAGSAHDRRGGRPAARCHRHRAPARRSRARGGRESLELSRCDGAGGDAARGPALRDQARIGRAAAGRMVSASLRLRVRRAFRHPAERGRGAGARGAGPRWRLADVLSRRYVRPCAGAAAFSHGGLRRCGERERAGRAGGAARHARGPAAGGVAPPARGGDGDRRRPAVSGREGLACRGGAARPCAAGARAHERRAGITTVVSGGPL